MADRGLGIDQRGKGQRSPGRRLAPGARRRGCPRHSPLHLRHRALDSLDTEPIAVALKFGFLAVLYLFLFWVSRSALRELRRTSAPAPEATGFHATAGPGGRSAATDASLVAVHGGGLSPGDRYDLFGGLSIGRSTEADVRIEDRFASSIHARLYSRGASYFVEDMGSTNGTFLNGTALEGEAELADLDQIKIGDTEMRFELELPGDG
ncbi:MAG: FHA domain-containing protein [Solirubrobacterales bacterium]|nr:FHA domain-containing protein [Solirubrobacterales bacterium]